MESWRASSRGSAISRSIISASQLGEPLGGLCVALLAPRLFSDISEYPITLFLTAALFVLALYLDRSSFVWKQPLLNGIPLCMILTALAAALIVHAVNARSGIRYIVRNFYGVLRITEDPGKTYLELEHGRVMHGFQYEDSDYARLRTSYYSSHSGVGLAITYHPRRNSGLRIGVVGLGVGTLAAYCEAQDTLCFYEINPAVLSLSEGAHPFFTYLHGSSGHAEVHLGDARLVMEDEVLRNEGQRFDVLALDAFSGDAIPVHLLTAEAMRVYLQELRGPNGVIAVHITNRYVDLIPVVEALAHRYQPLQRTGQHRRQ